MISVEQNQKLTRVGKGTPMGELLRRYWQPIAAITEFEDKATKPVRLMGENLVLYKDLSGTYGLIDRQCPHRRADMAYGWVEECGLRCSYHGWTFDENGSCISQPYEDTIKGAEKNQKFRDSVEMTSYPVKEMAGMLFAYLGPLPAPELPRWEIFDYKNGFAQIVISEIPCNWLQGVENNIDPVHFEWIHENWTERQNGKNYNSAATHLSIDIDEFEYGLMYRRTLEERYEDNPDDRRQRLISNDYSRLHLMPNIFCPIGTHLEYRVPIDDNNTLSVAFSWEAVPLEQQPYVQERIPHWYGPIKDSETGKWITTHVLNQDIVGWVGQGTITDRNNEHLGASDVGIVALRRGLKADLEAVEKGLDPSGVIRDPEKAKLVPWPEDRRSVLERGLPFDEWRRKKLHELRLTIGTDFSKRDYYAFSAGQPEDVKQEYEQAMGIKTKVEL
jgi:5,5'-dehydrodivanillate O-demethylase oxygenase subunit